MRELDFETGRLGVLRSLCNVCITAKNIAQCSLVKLEIKWIEHVQFLNRRLSLEMSWFVMVGR